METTQPLRHYTYLVIAKISHLRIVVFQETQKHFSIRLHCTCAHCPGFSWECLMKSGSILTPPVPNRPKDCNNQCPLTVDGPHVGRKANFITDNMGDGVNISACSPHALGFSSTWAIKPERPVGTGVGFEALQGARGKQSTQLHPSAKSRSL